ncbi:hypothetical protein GCM10009745_38490 [Kribbella yunnanensis]|uniref:LLM class flavin-dependent oxidoreductase n=1 Tax=Kribbella yunnanensis TaxID=190194 RepID=A0ABN2HKR6_9ACTN
MSESTADLAMMPGPTGIVLGRIESPMVAWRGNWAQRQSAIKAEEKAAQTGFDDVSINFRNAYNQAAPQLMEEVARVAPRVLGAVTTGRTIVARYVETFQQATSSLTL